MAVRKKRSERRNPRRFGVTGWCMSPEVFDALARLAKRRTSTKSAIIREAVISFLAREGELPDGGDA